jgi:hypothetical protein
MRTELEKFYALVDQIEIAMMTTRRPDGHLESRAMAIRDLEADPHVNLSYYNDRTREWISVSGLATISRDRQKIRELYATDWKAWFPEEGDPRHGTPEDPRFVQRRHLLALEQGIRSVRVHPCFRRRQCDGFSMVRCRSTTRSGYCRLNVSTITQFEQSGT